MNFVLITLFALGPVMAILAGIAFDTLPLVYNVPSFERTTMRHFLQLNALGQLFIHLGIYIGNWDVFIEFSGIGIVLMCLALLTLTPSSIDIVKQKSNSGEVGIFSYSPGLVLVFCSLFIVASWFMREIDGMIQVGIAFIVGIFCMMMMSTVMLSHFNRRLGWNTTNPKTLPVRFLHPHSPWDWLRCGEFSTSKGFDIRGCHRYRFCSSSLERIFHDESAEGFTVLHR